MPFTSETAKLLRGPGGRKTLRERDAEKQAAQIVREIIEAKASDIAKHFVKRTKKSDRVLIAAVDKLLPEIAPDANQRPIAIQVIVEGNSGAAHAETNGTGNGREILIGGE